MTQSTRFAGSEGTAVDYHGAQRGERRKEESTRGIWSPRSSEVRGAPRGGAAVTATDAERRDQAEWGQVARGQAVKMVLLSHSELLRPERGSLFLFAALVITLGVAATACTSNAQIVADREAAIQRFEADADALYHSLLSEAEARELPEASNDAAVRRWTSTWLAESDETRRRYFMSVVVAPSGMALRVNIVREAQSGADEATGDTTWEALERTEAVEREELDIVQSAYGRWQER